MPDPFNLAGMPLTPPPPEDFGSPPPPILPQYTPVRMVIRFFIALGESRSAIYARNLQHRIFTYFPISTCIRVEKNF